MSIIAGSTPKYYIKINDENGVQLDPSNPAQVTEVKVILYNATTGTIFGRYYLKTSPGSEWLKMTTKQIAAGDIRVVLVLSAEVTKAAEGNGNMIQVNTHVYDTEAPENTRIVIKRGQFHEIQTGKE